MLESQNLKKFYWFFNTLWYCCPVSAFPVYHYHFLDMANATIGAAKEGHGKPIQNPHGFLFAQLRAGYINPPEGYKSRTVRAQEIRNAQLTQELTTLKQLKEQQHELQFEIFKAALTTDDLARLDQEVRHQINPRIGLSVERQAEVYRETILWQWFEQQAQTSSRWSLTGCK